MTSVKKIPQIEKRITRPTHGAVDLTVEEAKYIIRSVNGYSTPDLESLDISMKMVGLITMIEEEDKT